MKQNQGHKGVISIGTAIGLFALLTVWAVMTLKGAPLALALIIVAGLAIKSYLHFLRDRIE
jgi:hypothetical protein